MGVPRAKKKKKNKSKNDAEVMGAIQELHKAILFLYLADKKKYKQKDIEEMNLFFARTILSFKRGDITFDTILDLLDKCEINLEEVGQKTDKFINDYWDMWIKGGL